MTKLEKIRVELQRLAEMAAEWQSLETVGALERELMLARLRDLYEMVRFEELVAKPSVVEDPQPQMDVVTTATVATAVSETATVVPEEEMPMEELLPDDTLVALDADALLAFEPLADMPIAEPEPEVDPEVEATIVETESMAEDVAEEVAKEPEYEDLVEVQSEIEPEVEPEVKPEITPEVEPEIAPEVKPEPVQAPVATPQNLFGEEEQVARHRHKQRVIMSLYDAPMMPAETPKPPVEEVPPVPRAEEIVPTEGELVAVACEPEVIEVAEAELEAAEEVIAPTVAAIPTTAPMTNGNETTTPVLGEVIQPVQTLADTIAPPRDVATELRHRAPITDLRRAVGINDKFLLIRDLFNGNGSLYEITIRRLNEFDNFDDCMIYIAEHFAWNPNTDGAKLMMELLERKFDQQ